MSYLDLSNNQLSGEIPAELGNLTRLQNLDLYGNRLTGELPDLNALRILRGFSLGGNDLDISWSTFESGGALDLASESRWNDRSLWGLYLQESGLTGQIPDWIGANHTELRRLWLHDNDLAGDVPANFWNMRDLESLRLHGNMLTEHWESKAWWRNLTDLTVPIDRFLNEGGRLSIAGESPIFLKLKLPSIVDPKRAHVRWYTNPYTALENRLQPPFRTAFVVKIVRDFGPNIVIELRENLDEPADDLNSMRALVCLRDLSGASAEPALLTRDGDGWKVLASAEQPAKFAQAVGEGVVCGTSLEEPSPPDTGGAAPPVSWLLILVIVGATTAFAGAMLIKAYKKRGLM